MKPTEEEEINGASIDIVEKPQEEVVGASNSADNSNQQLKDAEQTTTTTAITDNDAAKENHVKNVIPPTLPIEWTKMGEQQPVDIIRYPWDVAKIDSNETNVEIVGTSGQKITRMGEDLRSKLSPDVKHLVLRSHMIHTMEGIKGMKLELLELYDNMVDEIRELDTTDEDGEKGRYPGNSLRVLDLSYNGIRDLGPVGVCGQLQELYIAQNKIKSIKGIKHLKLLRKVDLGANRIRVIPAEELVGLDNLEELWLGKNKIEMINGLEKLTSLRVLDLQSNRLTSIENLTAQVDTLEEMYLGQNGINVEGAKCETGLALSFSKLTTLDMTRNRLTDTSPFAHLTTLNDIWISGIDIKTFEDVAPLQSLINLTGIYLEYNSIAQDFEYRKKLKEIIPSLSQIDADVIGIDMTYNRGPGVMELMKTMQERALNRAQGTDELADDSVIIRSILKNKGEKL